mmetsp:Transcript_56767/g.123383  ORF Transcript_56767/g.123383 Transcript_56767/m.123383 type:complete len:264 (+) Transcript_56767:715-1506(+)
MLSSRGWGIEKICFGAGRFGGRDECDFVGRFLGEGFGAGASFSGGSSPVSAIWSSSGEIRELPLNEMVKLASRRLSARARAPGSWMLLSTRLRLVRWHLGNAWARILHPTSEIWFSFRSSDLRVSLVSRSVFSSSQPLSPTAAPSRSNRSVVVFDLNASTRSCNDGNVMKPEIFTLSPASSVRIFLSTLSVTLVEFVPPLTTLRGTTGGGGAGAAASAMATSVVSPVFGCDGAADTPNVGSAVACCSEKPAVALAAWPSTVPT